MQTHRSGLKFSQCPCLWPSVASLLLLRSKETSIWASKPTARLAFHSAPPPDSNLRHASRPARPHRHRTSGRHIHTTAFSRMAAVASAIQEDFASIRQRVLQEHPNLSKSIQLSSASAQLQSDPLALLGKPLRQHELWSRYGPRDLTPTQAQSGAVIAVGAASVYDTVADIEDNEEEHETYTRQAERAFGPAYVSVCLVGAGCAGECIGQTC